MPAAGAPTDVGVGADQRRVLALFLFVSGALALVYEIVWQRQFALVFGSAAPATAAVLAAYFAGLGTGSWVVGRRARRWSRPLRAYAVLELAIGAGALLVAPLLAGFDAVYPRLFDAMADQPAAFVTLRTAAAFLVLFVPTFCMGGTLPLLGEVVDRGRRQLGLTAGWLYVANTAGAGLGALTVPFLLLPALGLSGTVWLCASGNAALAAAMWWIDRRTAPRMVRDVPPAGPTRPCTAKSEAEPRRPVQVLALISGISTFALQVLWNRAFAQIHENSMYSFAVIVAVVIFALAIGAQLARLGLRRTMEPRRLIGGAWMLAGVAVLAGPWIFLRLTDHLSYLAADGGWMNHAGTLVGMAMVLLLIPMALLGVGLPAIMEDAGRSSAGDASRVLGGLLGVNVAGAVAGALVAGFVSPPWFGLWSSIVWCGALLIAAGLWQRYGASLWSGLVLAAFWIASGWPISQMDLPRVRLAANPDERLVALAEGTHGITAVVERPGSRRMKLNNHYALGGTAATGDERMQAHVPLLLHPAPRSVAFLGLGTGITAGGALFHPVERIAVMELVPEVVDAARAYFAEANGGVLDDARVRVAIDDARHHLRGSGERYDVIVGDLVVPWRQGEGALFTLEQFQIARAALAPGGLFCQWLPLFQLSAQETTILLRTFLTVFPHTQVWRGDFSPTEPAIALIGATDDFVVDAAAVGRRLGEMRPDAANPHLGSPAAVWMNYVGGLEPGDLPTTDPRLNSEDRPWIELLGPMRHAGGDAGVVFTGRRLQAWLDRVKERTRDRGAALPEVEAAAVNAGSSLAEMMLCLAENDVVGADAAAERMRRLLPDETFRQLLR